MELRQLECFVAVAEERSFTRAAARLHLVQSTVSATVAALESELAVPLLVRTTPEGRPLRRGVRVPSQGPGGRSTPYGMRGTPSMPSRAGCAGPLRIGTMSSLGPLDLPALLGRFHPRSPRDLPALVTVASCGGSPGLITALAEGRLDLASSRSPGRPRPAARLRHLISTPLDPRGPARAPPWPAATRRRSRTWPTSPSSTSRPVTGTGR
ncbi:LysR family transcriptional regulator [Streptomyces sp. PG2]